ncbi:L,D-transpeptidase family protein [Kitasatospora misakiensis]|uniref:L,D-transpeptidase family protein n=1 Tax=Kitasatospora misakiensis TaxID=67330 RepID=A0ABW0X130_9ACTN
MSGYRRTSPYPSYEPVYEQVYEQGHEASRQPYGGDQADDQWHGQQDRQPYEQQYEQQYRQPQQWPDGQPHPQPYAQPAQPYGAPYGPPAGAYGDQAGAWHAEPYQAPYEASYGEQDHSVYGYRSLAEHDVYDRPFQDSPAEPAWEPEPRPAAGPAQPVVPRQATASPAPASEAAAPGSRAAARGRRRKPPKKRTGRAVTAGTALLLAAAAGWYTVGQDDAKTGVTTAAGPEGVAAPDHAAARPGADQPSPTAAPAAQAADARQDETPAADRSEARADGSVAAIPGLGASFAGRIPAETTQVVLASGEGKDTNRATVTLWTRTAEGRWLAGESWQGHNAFKGWTTDHNEGDLRSPIGVFSLTDAGGRKADPGSRLPYDKDSSFVVSGTGFAGEQLAGSFDYVVAINYNRVPGNSPLDRRRPNGSTKGGGIWIHVDHGGPTHGCVSIPEDKMAQLIRTLDPAAHPVIVMGDTGSLAA